MPLWSKIDIYDMGHQKRLGSRYQKVAATTQRVEFGLASHARAQTSTAPLGASARASAQLLSQSRPRFQTITYGVLRRRAKSKKAR